MKFKTKLLIASIICLLFCTIANASSLFTDFSNDDKGEISFDCLDQFGFDVIYDPYDLFQNKLFFINTYSNSSAEKANIKVGDEILKINNKKIKKMSLDEIYDALTADKNINLEIKSKFKKRGINLFKSNICTAKNIKETDTYFTGIYDNDINEIERIIRYSGKISNKLSKRMRNYIQQQERNTNYWLLEKQKFENAYNICKSSYKNSIAQHNCLFSNINKQLVNTQKHKSFFSNYTKSIKTKL